MKLSKFLMTAAFAVIAAAPALANGPQATTTRPLHHGGPPPPMMFFDKMDANHDGVVTKAEWMNDAAAKFAEIDHNHDGKITKKEIWAFHCKMKAQHPEWMPHHDEAANDHGPDHAWTHEDRTYRHSDYYTGNRPNLGAPGYSTSAPAAGNEVDPDRRPAGADGAGGWTAQ